MPLIHKAIFGKAGLALALLTIGGLAAAPAHADGPNLVVNPGFEAGDFTDYSSSGSAFVTTGGHTGFFAAEFSADDNGTAGLISQNIATITGHVYNVSFFLEEPGSSHSTSEFQASFAGFQGADVVNANTSAFTQYSFTATATGSTSVLQLEGQSIPLTPQGAPPLLLDDISVRDTSPVPEASSFVSVGLLLALGLGGAAVSRRRRARSR